MVQSVSVFALISCFKCIMDYYQFSQNVPLNHHQLMLIYIIGSFFKWVEFIVTIIRISLNSSCKIEDPLCSMTRGPPASMICGLRP
jgi:hypothetical protein